MDINNLWSGYDLNSKKQNSRCLSVNTILEGKYLVGPVLGQGGFGITYVGYDLNMESKIAIKEYFPVELVSRDTTTHGDRVLSLGGEKNTTYKTGLKKYVEEAQKLSQFADVPGVASVKDFFFANETAYIVMELLEGLDLKTYQRYAGGRLSEEETLRIMKPVMEALLEIHKAGIIHRDISPDNIILTFEDKVGAESVNGVAAKDYSKIHAVKLIDFGAARMTANHDQKSLTIILKHGYAPPEQYTRNADQGSWTDVYALCAVLYRMLTGETPVSSTDRIMGVPLKPFSDFGAKVSANTAAAILKGLAVKKEDRIQSVQELIGALYEGAKVKTTLAKNGKKTPIAIGAAVAACVAVGAVFMLVGKKEELPTETVVSAESVSQMQNDSAAAAEKTAAEMAEANNENTTAAPKEVLVLDPGAGEEIGPQIVWPRAETMMAGGFNHVLSLRDDGTVLAAGDNFRGQCEVTDWDNIAAVYAGDYISLGLKTDGTVVTAGRMTGATVSEGDVSSWTGIVDIAVCNTHILGLTEDGHVISAGSGESGCCDTGDWENICDIWVEDKLSFAVDQESNLFVAGTMTDQEEVLEEIKNWKNVIDIDMYGSEGDSTVYAINADGKALYAGSRAENYAEELAQWADVVALEVGDGFLAGLKEDGTMVRVGHSQNKEIEAWTDVCALASTQYELIGLKTDGSYIMTEPVVTGNASLEEILALKNVKDAVWTDNCLYVLKDDGSIALTGYVEYWRDEGEDEMTWTNIKSLESSSKGVAAITEDGRVKMPLDKTYTYDYDETSELSHEEQSKLAQEHMEQTPKLWENWSHVKSVSRSERHVAALMENGEVKAGGYPGEQSKDGTDYKTGLTFNGSCDVYEWTDIKQVVATNNETYGVKEDGTLVSAGTDTDVSAYSNIDSLWKGGNSLFAITKEGKPVHILGSTSYGQNNTATWENLVQIAPGSQHTVGLKADGTVVAVGSNFCGQCDVEEWTDVVSISAGPSSTTGITSDGRILMAGILPDDVWVMREWEPIDMTKMRER